MDWTAIIEKNRNALVRILGMLVTMANIYPHPEASGSREPRQMPRHFHRAILRLLRPAEAAARRLVIIAAREIAFSPPPALQATSPAAQGRISSGDAGTPEILPRLRGRGTAGGGGGGAVMPPRLPKPTSIFVRSGKGTGIVLPRGVRPSDILPGLARPRPARRTFSLPLADRLPGWPRPRAIAGATLRISVPGITSRMPVRRPPMPDDLIDATRLALRLQAVGRALDDLPGHARRFARWRDRAAAGAQNNEGDRAAAHPPLRSGGGGLKGRRGRFVRTWPLRPGRPPGSRRRRPTHEVHEILADLQYFANRALELPPPCGASRPIFRSSQ